ncbi:hypothetical protein HPB51_001028 [Rhipicephalus microplus]|uniref:Uncharacterized protein n=1 Tax=Rhipicephalus microplus TaxID=6941 RepID=A0A9J6DEI8_RHIMP|nr:hypothetical protein HPB51_001028 [Rhipicephalus microplus]
MSSPRRGLGSRLDGGVREYIYETKQSFWLAYDPENEGEYYIRLKLLMTSRSVDVMHIIPLIKVVFIQLA